ncbi:MAG: hypothetical protein MJZ00_05270 [Paludibacteraceae bacterium]|nr:hypothetical protein [Paludibacteraceae bacterium]
MSLNYKYQLEPLRDWFLKESPREAVLDFKEKVMDLLDTPESFVEKIQDNGLMQALNKDMQEMDQSFAELESISNFIDYNADEDEGITPFEYLLGSKVTVGREKLEFIRSQFMFYRDIHSVIEIQKVNDPDNIEPFLEALKNVIKKTCGEKEHLRLHLEGYAQYMSELNNVEEANESYALMECMTDENYEGFLRHGQQMIDNFLAVRKQREDKEAF